jgi:predicted transcriptional regulator
MTTITLDLPDDVAALLSAQAAANDTTPKAYAEAMLVDELIDRLIDDARLGPYEPSKSELLILEKAEADIAAGRWVSHKDVFAKVRASLRRD